MGLKRFHTKNALILLLALSLGTLIMPSLAWADEEELQWTEISNPELVNLCDIAVAPEPRSLFAATYNSTGPEVVWRSAGTPLGEFWGPVLTMDTTSNRIILRLSPSYSRDYTIYVAEVGGDLIAVSHNRGNSWKEQHAPGPVIDMAVEDEDTIYIALSRGFIQKSTDAAWTWQDSVDSNLSKLTMLTVAEGGTVFVGGSNGEVAYSLDGGNTFIKIPEDIGDSDVQVIADINYGENGIIYASSDKGVYRWSIGVSTTWQRIVKGSGIVGLAGGSEGALYALKPSESVIRLLNPSTSNKTEMDLMDLPAEGSSPIVKLSITSEENELWTFGAANNVIYYFTDTLCKAAPSLDAPFDGATIPLGSTGRVSYLNLKWNELPEATIYEAAIYLDSDCNQRVWLNNSDTTSIILRDDSVRLTASTTYYWRTRAIAPLKSSWSESRSFTIGLGGVQATSPATGTTGVLVINGCFTWNSYPNATEYEFILSENADLTSPLVTDRVTSTAYGYSGTLDYGTTYFWGVKISKPALGPLSVFTFTTRAAPPEISPPAQVEAVSPVITPIWVWLIIGICVALLAAVVILVFRTR